MGTTSAGKAGFITALYIVLVPVFSTVLGKKAKKSIWLCVIAAVAGLYFLCFDGSSTLSFSSGDMYVFLSAFAFTARSLLWTILCSRWTALRCPARSLQWSSCSQPSAHLHLASTPRSRR